MVPISWSTFIGHAFAMLPSVVPQVQATVAAFLDKHLVDPQFYVQENLKLNQFAGPAALRQAPDSKRPNIGQ